MKIDGINTNYSNIKQQTFGYKLPKGVYAPSDVVEKFNNRRFNLSDKFFNEYMDNVKNYLSEYDAKKAWKTFLSKLNIDSNGKLDAELKYNEIGECRDSACIFPAETMLSIHSGRRSIDLNCRDHYWDTCKEDYLEKYLTSDKIDKLADEVDEKIEALVKDGIKELTERAQAYSEVKNLLSDSYASQKYRLSISDKENLNWDNVNEIADRTYFRSPECIMRKTDHEFCGGSFNDYETFFSDFSN